MANGPVNPGAATSVSQNQQLQELLQQGKMRLAKELGQEPTQGQQFTNFANLLGASRMGFEPFQAEQQRQTENEMGRNQQLGQFITAQEQLSIQQQEQQRLALHQAHQRALEEGNTAAGVMTEITGGNTEDIAKLTQWWMGQLMEAGQDDDDLDPRLISGMIAQEYQSGIAEGRYQGPQAEPISVAPGTTLYDPNTNKELFTGPREDLDRIAKKARAEQEARANAQIRIDKAKAGLPGTGGKIPVNVILPSGKNVLAYEPFTHYEDETGTLIPIPKQGTVILGRETAYRDIKEEKITTQALEDLNRINAKLQPQTRSMITAIQEGGVGPWSKLARGIQAVVGGLEIPELFGYSGTMFPKSEENAVYLKSLSQLGKVAIVNNPKFPVAEQDIVRGLFPDPDLMWVDPDAEVRKLMSLHDTLVEWKRANLIGISDPGLDLKTKQELKHKNFQVDRILMFMGLDPDNTVLFNEPKSQTKINNLEQYNKFINDPNIPSGTPYIDPDGTPRLKP